MHYSAADHDIVGQGCAFLEHGVSLLGIIRKSFSSRPAQLFITL
jgi:hypothetical protein